MAAVRCAGSIEPNVLSGLSARGADETAQMNCLRNRDRYAEQQNRNAEAQKGRKPWAMPDQAESFRSIFDNSEAEPAADCLEVGGGS